MRFFKKLVLDILYLLAKCAIGVKVVLTFTITRTTRLIARALRLIGERPLIILYRRFLGLQFRLADLGTPLKNPILYALASKSLGYALLFLLTGFFVAENIHIQEGEADILNPNNIISRMVINEENMIFIEGGDLFSGITSEYESPLSGVKASPMLGAGQDSVATGDPGDVSVQSGALLKPVIPSTSESAPSADTIRTYTVQRGDTLSGIARRFGLRTNTVAWANNLDVKKSLQEGKQLTILPVDGVLHRVQQGDSLSKIAQRYDADTREIATYNHLALEGALRSGISIIVPNGTMSTSNIAQGTGIIGTIKNIITGTPSASTPTPSSAVARASGMIWPTSATRITQYYGWSHTGIDIAGPVSNSIYAANAGRVVISQSGYNGGYGNTIVVDHGNGIQTRYGHASKLLVSKGDYVTRGQVIAMVGSTGRSTGPHLHFEVLVNGSRVNPLGYIR